MAKLERTLIWRCERGHECAVSDLTMVNSIVRPRCTVKIGVGICGARLDHPLREFGGRR